jgi:hypothetical protein
VCASRDFSSTTDFLFLDVLPKRMGAPKRERIRDQVVEGKRCGTAAELGAGHVPGHMTPPDLPRKESEEWMK